MAQNLRYKLFWLIALALPVVFIVGIEFFLRIIGYGQDYPLFITDKANPEYQITNPDVIKRYFPSLNNVPSVKIETTFLKKEKDPDTLRLVVQGGSTAAGFPYGLNASLTGQLERRIRRAMPGKNVEVISTAMSAVNSYTLMDFTDEIIAVKPDAVLIYAGHNEFLGILGAGSSFTHTGSRAATLAFLKFKSSRIYKLISDLYFFMTVPADKAGTPENRGSLMARIARSKEIPFQSDIYEQTYRQFEGNLDIILSKYKAAGIPVYIATVASNEKDQRPFVSVVAQQNALWQQAIEAGANALEERAYRATIGHLDNALGFNPEHALTHYHKARALEGLENPPHARKHYLNAKDYDALRFRAPEEFNDIIRTKAQARGAILVDAQKTLLDATPNGIIGNDLMLEHLHPNVEGYFLLGQAFYHSLVANQVVRPQIEVTEEQFRLENPVSQVEALLGRYKIERLMSDYPFKETAVPYKLPKPEGVIAELAQGIFNEKTSWLNAHQSLYNHFQKSSDSDNALKTALMLADAMIFRADIQLYVGQMLLIKQRYKESLIYLNRSDRIKPDNLKCLLALGRAHMLIGDATKAKEYLNRVLTIEPDNSMAKKAIQLLAKRP